MEKSNPEANQSVLTVDVERLCHEPLPPAASCAQPDLTITTSMTAAGRSSERRLCRYSVIDH
jgi:hypothetical protein